MTIPPPDKYTIKCDHELDLSFGEALDSYGYPNDNIVVTVDLGDADEYLWFDDYALRLMNITNLSEVFK